MQKAGVGGSYGLSHLSAHPCIKLFPNTALQYPQMQRKQSLSSGVRVKER